MPIVPLDLTFHLSQPGAGRGMDVASAPEQSLGGRVSTTEWNDESTGLFPDITGADNENGLLDARCLFLHNRHAELPLLDAVIWIERKAEGGALLQVAADPTPARPARTEDPQALIWGDGREGTFEWRDAEGKRQAVRIGTIPAGHVKAFWIKRQAHRLPAIRKDFFLLRLRGDTAQ
jgi:hypothetical protein